MSLRFSRVTLYSAGKTANYLVGGIPKSRTDLQGWTAYGNFVSEVPRYTTVNAHVETFLYGGEDPFDATPEEVAYFYKRIKRQPDFIDIRSEKAGESDFTIFNL